MVMSTPAGRLSFLSSSTVLGVGWTMSSMRLCVRISNWSIDFLSTWGLRFTVNRSTRVGSGMGPTTSEPADWAHDLGARAAGRLDDFGDGLVEDPVVVGLHADSDALTLHCVGYLFSMDSLTARGTTANSSGSME